MKEVLNREFIDLRKFDNPINPIDLIKNLTSNPVSFFSFSENSRRFKLSDYNDYLIIILT